uniref:Uncharacterized protein n=1 Tax=Romanomermis culicivorax TaxID=13658 RepID=A0A915I9B2_ROMCU
MDTRDAEIIPLIAKYFNFQQLCMAERINQNFRRFIILEMRLLKIIYFTKISSCPRYYDVILEKICLYCPKVETLCGLDDVLKYEPELEKLVWSESFRHLKHLNIDYRFLKNGQIYTVLKLLENRSNFTTININIGTTSATQDVFARISNALIRQKIMTGFGTSFYGRWINLPVLRNMTSFSFSNYQWMSEECYLKFYEFLNANLYLEHLSFTNIKIDLILVKTLFSMKKLKRLSLNYYVFANTSAQIWAEIGNWLETNTDGFENLEEFSLTDRYVRRTSTDRNFAIIILNRSPVLKRLYLTTSSFLSSNNILTRKLANPHGIECISVATDDVYYDHMTVVGICKMSNLRHFHVKNCLHAQDALKISTSLKNLKFLQLAEDYYDYLEDYRKVLKTFLSNLKLEGLALDSNLCAVRKSSEIVDWIYNFCPRLRYLSVDDQPITKHQMQILPEKLPALKILSISYSSGFRMRLSRLKLGQLFDAKDLLFAVKKMSFLNVLVLDEKMLDEFYGYKLIKNQCRRCKLAVFCRPATARTKKLMQKLFGECSESA